MTTTAPAHALVRGSFLEVQGAEERSYSMANERGAEGQGGCWLPTQAPGRTFCQEVSRALRPGWILRGQTLAAAGSLLLLEAPEAVRGLFLQGQTTVPKKKKCPLAFLTMEFDFHSHAA